VKREYQLSDLDSLKGDSPLYGVIGSPIKHSLSPEFMGPALQTLNSSTKYTRFYLPEEELAQGIKKLKEIGVAGWNITLPHKNHVIDFLDEIHPEAMTMGAVNVVHNDEGHLIGYNTDGRGWSRAIRENFQKPVSDFNVLIIGCGGAGQALAAQVLLEDAPRLILMNRTLEVATHLAHHLQLAFPKKEKNIEVLPWGREGFKKALSKSTLVVNTSTVGLKQGDDAMFSSDLLNSSHYVFDSIYSRETELLQAAKQAGARNVGGLDMLLYQGVLSYEIWTKQEAPLESMRKNLYSAFQASQS
jgi:shikimate dehydrogenase